MDAGLGQRQPVEKGWARAAGADLGDILGIGGQDFRDADANGRFDRREGPILLLG